MELLPSVCAHWGGVQVQLSGKKPGPLALPLIATAAACPARRTPLHTPPPPITAGVIDKHLVEPVKIASGEPSDGGRRVQVGAAPEKPSCHYHRGKTPV